MTASLWWLPAAVVAILTAHAWVNARLLRRPRPSPVESPVSVPVPVRDEAHQVRAWPLVALSAQIVARQIGPRDPDDRLP